MEEQETQPPSAAPAAEAKAAPSSPVSPQSPRPDTAEQHDAGTAAPAAAASPSNSPPPPPPTVLIPPPLARQASSDDDSLADTNASVVEQFEDEPPDENHHPHDTKLPKPSPKRLAARIQRRKSAPKRRLDHSGHNGNNTYSGADSVPKVPGLPKLRMFKHQTRVTTTLQQPPSRADDESSHWSSSDGESYGDEGPEHRQRRRHERAQERRQWLSADDIEICQRLDEEYERALEEREVVYTARYNSVRQSACFSIFFMLLYLSLGTMFFVRQANWTVSESILFSIYTITTVGYGHLDTPDTPAFQLYVIFFIFIGIAGITLMVAQTYQYIALVASRADHAREQAQLARIREQGQSLHAPRLESAASSSQADSPGGATPDNSTRIAQQMMEEMNIPSDWVDRIFKCIEQTRIFLSTTEVGRSISVVLPFVGLILVGAMVIGPIEGWTLTESLYFAVVSLTTVGFGDFAPTHNSSILFCIIWLPCSIGFMSLYLTNVAAFYIRLSDKNIERIEEQLRRRVKLAKDIARKERAAARRRALRGQELESSVPAGSADDAKGEETTGVAASGGDVKSVDSDAIEQSSKEEEDVHLFGSPDQLGEEVATRREKILMNFRGQWQRDDGAESDGSGESLVRRGRGLATMKDMLRAVHANMPKGTSRVFQSHGPEQEILSLRSNRFMDSHSLRQGSLRKPSFALRALVQERFAEIIAAEVAGFESGIEIKENTLSVTIGTLRQTTSKWMVPRRARRAFRAVAFEALYFVGEHGLITRGADALFDLSPMEFHRLFTPLLAALGDADSMEAWLATTDVLADVDLGNRSGVSTTPSGDMDDLSS